MDEKLVMSWQSALTAQRANPVLDSIKSSVAIRARKKILSLCSCSSEIPLGELHTALES